MSGSRRHLVGSASALAISAVMTLLVASTVLASGPAVVHRVERRRSRRVHGTGP